MSLKVLICPLHWGLGHASRCRSIIDIFLAHGHEVHLASDGLAEAFLRLHYPDLTIHTLARLEIRYGRLFWVKLFTQIFQVIQWMIRDRKRIRSLHTLYGYDLIISDSRPAAIIKEVTSVLVIHQTRPIIPWKIIQKLTSVSMDRWMSGFDRIWIPDLPANAGLSGSLSLLPWTDKVRRVGFLTTVVPDTRDQVVPSPNAILAIVSGPEPMRSQFEDALRSSLPAEEVMVVGGRPDAEVEMTGYQSFVHQSQLSGLVAACHYLICRGGYSTLMDMAGWSKKLVLVPTPDQPEQEYLAGRLVGLRMAVIWDMDKDPWSVVKAKANLCDPFFMANDPHLLKNAVDEIEQYCEKKINFPQ